MIAGGELLRGRGRGRYRRVQEALPRRWVVEATEGRHHNDGDFLDGGRRRRAMVDLTGRGFWLRIKAWVRPGGGLGGC